MPDKRPTLKVVELCSGIGCQLRGLENSGVFDVECVATSEINIDAIICYSAIHHGLTEEMVDNYDFPPLDEIREYLEKLNIGYSPEKDATYNWRKSGKVFERKIKKTYLACLLSKNLGDISRIEYLPKANLWFISAPCSDISNAGRMEGLAEGSGTRSSIVWNTIRLLRNAKEMDALPEYMMLENVKNLVSKVFINDFNRLNEKISEFGYNVYYQIIDAKNTGIPQHRERVFVVYIRKDIDKCQFTFPQPFDNCVYINDVLFDEVDESYYIETEKVHDLIKELVDSDRVNLAEIADAGMVSTRI